MSDQFVRYPMIFQLILAIGTDGIVRYIREVFLWANSLPPTFSVVANPPIYRKYRSHLETWVSGAISLILARAFWKAHRRGCEQKFRDVRPLMTIQISQLVLQNLTAYERL